MLILRAFLLNVTPTRVRRSSAVTSLDDCSPMSTGSTTSLWSLPCTAQDLVHTVLHAVCCSCLRPPPEARTQPLRLRVGAGRCSKPCARTTRPWCVEQPRSTWASLQRPWSPISSPRSWCPPSRASAQTVRLLVPVPALGIQHVDVRLEGGPSSRPLMCLDMTASLQRPWSQKSSPGSRCPPSRASAQMVSAAAASFPALWRWGGWGLCVFVQV